MTRALTLAALLALASPAIALERHVAPAENLSVIDARELAHAERTIDMAAYVLTDRPVIAALEDAARRGVVVRVYLDPSQGRRATIAVHALEEAGVDVRFKPRGPLQHLKVWVVDGHLLRTGSANFSLSGERRQDNDLVLIDDPTEVARAEAQFERLFESGVEGE